jgi:hypothetical protein
VNQVGVDGVVRGSSSRVGAALCFHAGSGDGHQLSVLAAVREARPSRCPRAFNISPEALPSGPPDVVEVDRKRRHNRELDVHCPNSRRCRRFTLRAARSSGDPSEVGGPGPLYCLEALSIRWRGSSGPPVLAARCSRPHRLEVTELEVAESRILALDQVTRDEWVRRLIHLKRWRTLRNYSATGHQVHVGKNS